MLSRATLALFAFSAAAFGQVSAPISKTYTTSSTLPPVGLASSETAQVNVVNAAPFLASAAGGAFAFLGPSCAGTISFYDANGAIIGKPTSFALGGRQIFSVSLPFASTGASGPRTVIRAEIAIGFTASIVSSTGAFVSSTTTVSSVPAPGIALAPCALESSLEIYDTITGVMHAVVPGTSATVGVLNLVTGGVLTTPR